MTEQPESGELLVGSYLRLVERCELVMYNQRSQQQGDQLEIDVIGVYNTERGDRVVYTCEVVTHIDGLHYSGTPDTDRWAEYGNDDYQHTLERLWRKFNSDKGYVTTSSMVTTTLSSFNSGRPSCAGTATKSIY